MQAEKVGAATPVPPPLPRARVRVPASIPVDTEWAEQLAERERQRALKRMDPMVLDLHAAASAGEFAAVKKLLDQKVHPDSPDVSCCAAPSLRPLCPCR